MTAPRTDHPRPARTAHGAGYWLTVGWFWSPAKFVGRACLWLVFWPAGLWRSWRHGRKADAARARRGQ